MIEQAAEKVPLSEQAQRLKAGVAAGYSSDRRAGAPLALAGQAVFRHDSAGWPRRVIERERIDFSRHSGEIF